MKPSARLRSRPCSESRKRANGTPRMKTSPPVGASSPPNRCSSVLLPDPDAPTTASRSPGTTARSTPSSTGTSSGPLRYVFLRPRHSSTGAVLFIPQRLRGIDPCGTPARVERSQERQRKRDRSDKQDIGLLHLRRQLADVIDALVEELHAENAYDERDDGIDVESEREATRDAEQC